MMGETTCSISSNQSVQQDRHFAEKEEVEVTP